MKRRIAALRTRLPRTTFTAVSEKPPYPRPSAISAISVH